MKKRTKFLSFRPFLLAIGVGILALTGKITAQQSLYLYKNLACDKATVLKFYSRNCTDYAGWRINFNCCVPLTIKTKTSDAFFSNSGFKGQLSNAFNWTSRLTTRQGKEDYSYLLKSIPYAGDIQTFKSINHVRYVESYTNGSFYWTDWNGESCSPDNGTKILSQVDTKDRNFITVNTFVLKASLILTEARKGQLFTVTATIQHDWKNSRTVKLRAALYKDGNYIGTIEEKTSTTFSPYQIKQVSFSKVLTADQGNYDVVIQCQNDVQYQGFDTKSWFNIAGIVDHTKNNAIYANPVPFTVLPPFVVKSENCPEYIGLGTFHNCGSCSWAGIQFTNSERGVILYPQSWVTRYEITHWVEGSSQRTVRTVYPNQVIAYTNGQGQTRYYIKLTGLQTNTWYQVEVKAYCGEKFSFAGPVSFNNVVYRLEDETKSKSHILSIYPNPAQNNVTIDLGDNAGASANQVTVTDVFGKRTVVPATVNANTVNLDMSDLAQGVYIIEIFTGETRFFGKFVKE